MFKRFFFISLSRKISLIYGLLLLVLLTVVCLIFTYNFQNTLKNNIISNVNNVSGKALINISRYLDIVSAVATNISVDNRLQSYLKDSRDKKKSDDSISEFFAIMNLTSELKMEALYRTSIYGIYIIDLKDNILSRQVTNYYRITDFDWYRKWRDSDTFDYWSGSRINDDDIAINVNTFFYVRKIIDIKNLNSSLGSVAIIMDVNTIENYLSALNEFKYILVNKDNEIVTEHGDVNVNLGDLEESQAADGPAPPRAARPTAAKRAAFPAAR